MYFIFKIDRIGSFFLPRCSSDVATWLTKMSPVQGCREFGQTESGYANPINILLLLQP